MTVDFDKLITKLQARIGATRERLTGLRGARRPHALDAVSGNRKARKAIAGIDAEVASAAAEGETLAIALEEAERQKGEAQEKAAEEERLQREAEARRIAVEIFKVSKQADQAAVHLVMCLDTRANLISKLSETRAVYPGVPNTMRKPLRICAALWSAGLGRHGVLQHVVGTVRRPLCEADAIRPELIGQPQTATETRNDGDTVVEEIRQ